MPIVADRSLAESCSTGPADCQPALIGRPSARRCGRAVGDRTGLSCYGAAAFADTLQRGGDPQIESKRDPESARLSEKPLHPVRPLAAEPSPRAPARDVQPRGATAGPVAAGVGDELSLSGMVATLVRGWWMVALVASVVVLVAVGYLKVRQLEYRAMMVLAPAELDIGTADGLVRNLEQFASLAVLAERPTKLEQVSPIERYGQIIGSLPFAERLRAAEPGIMQAVFRADWDEETGTWRQPPGILLAGYYGIVRFFGYPGWSEPDGESLANFLRNRVEFTVVWASSMRRLALDHPDPELAVTLLERVHAVAEDLLRERARERMAAQISQLEEDLAEPALTPGRRAALEAILARQYQTQALLRADVPYAAEVLSPASAPAEPSSANPILVLALAGVVGVIFGIFAVFLRAALRHQPAA